MKRLFLALFKVIFKVTGSPKPSVLCRFRDSSASLDLFDLFLF